MKKTKRQAKITPESLLTLKQYFRDMLLVATLSYEEYRDLPDFAKAMAKKAALENRAEAALELAAAIRSDTGALAVSAELDGGDALVRHTLVGAVAQAIAKRKKAQ